MRAKDARVLESHSTVQTSCSTTAWLQQQHCSNSTTDYCCSITAVRMHDLGMHGCSDTALLLQQSGYCSEAIIATARQVKLLQQYHC